MTEEPQEENREGKKDRLKESTDKIWDATRKTFQTASFRAGQYSRIVQKKIDLASLHKKISVAHGDLGRLIDNLRQRESSDLLASEEVQTLLRKLDGYKKSAAELEEEIESLRTPMPKEEGPVSTDEQNEDK